MKNVNKKLIKSLRESMHWEQYKLPELRLLLVKLRLGWENTKEREAKIKPDSDNIEQIYKF